jgi:23S rRNA pseudouridine2605 synthase
MRLQRALARAGVASRRASEELIRAGQVRVDGAVATLGSSVDPDRQVITVRGRRVTLKPRRWIALHKPMGVVTTAGDEHGRRTVFDLIPDPAGLAYVGRLDANTTGLLLLTTDGEAIHRLTHPRYRIPRHYTALVHGRPPAEIAAVGARPVQVEGRPIVPTQVRVRPGHEGRSIVDITLTEGRHHAVRKWAEAIGLKVERLARLSYGPVRLGDLPPGAWRLLTPSEEAALYAAVRMEPDPDTPPPRRGRR